MRASRSIPLLFCGGWLAAALYLIFTLPERQERALERWLVELQEHKELGEQMDSLESLEEELLEQICSSLLFARNPCPAKPNFAGLEGPRA